MKKMCVRMVTVCLALLLSFSTAFGWGSATHAYIAERLNNKLPWLTLNQVYGSMAPDLFNLMPPADLSCLTHCCYFMKVWRLPALPAGRAQAFGLVSHNQDWGADFDAHNPGCCGETPADGYIFWKAYFLDIYLSNPPLPVPVPPEENPYLQLTSGLDPAVKMELLRDVVEYGVDLLIKKNLDQAIGAKLVFAGALRSPELPITLSAAYADDVSRLMHISRLEAVKLIIRAEAEFQKMTIDYGKVLSLPDDQALTVLAGQLTEMAAPYGIPPSAASLIAQVLATSMQMCEQDLQPNLTATIQDLKSRMAAHNIRY